MSPAVTASALIAIIVMVAIVCAFVILDRRDEDRHGFPDDRTDPYGDRWVAELHHGDDGRDWLDVLPSLAIAGERLEPLAIEPAAETGELPMIRCELGQDFDEYWAGLVAGQEAAT